MDLSLRTEENWSINSFYMLQHKFIEKFLLDINFESKYVDFMGRVKVSSCLSRLDSHLARRW